MDDPSDHSASGLQVSSQNSECYPKQLDNDLLKCAAQKLPAEGLRERQQSQSGSSSPDGRREHGSRGKRADVDRRQDTIKSKAPLLVRELKEARGVKRKGPLLEVDSSLRL